MDAGFFNNGLVGAILATVWFFQRYAQIESDYSNITPYAARLRSIALVLAAAAIPIGSALVFVLVLSIMSGPSLLGFDAPTWYVSALMLMLAMLAAVEIANAAYRLRMRAEERLFDPYRPRSGEGKPKSTNRRGAGQVGQPLRGRSV